MNPLKHYSLLLYLQITLGVICYTMALGDATLGLMALGVIAFSWIYCHVGADVKNPRPDNGPALPRWAIFVIAIVVTLWTLRQHPPTQQTRVVEALSEYILYLNLIKLFDRRSTRDDGQILLINGMLVVSGVMFTVTLAFGAMLLAYMILTLLTVMTMQIKIAHDQAWLAYPPAPSPDPLLLLQPAGRAYRVQFRDTALILGLVCLGLSIVGFITIPRFAINLPPIHYPQNPVTGFNPDISLSDDTSISQSMEPVIYLRVTRDSKNIGDSMRTLLIRGNPLDRYDARDHRWSRSRTLGEYVRLFKSPAFHFTDSTVDASAAQYDFTLLRQFGGILFSVSNPVSIISEAHENVNYNELDGRIEGYIPGKIKGALQYGVIAADKPVMDKVADAVQAYAATDPPPPEPLAASFRGFAPGPPGSPGSPPQGGPRPGGGFSADRYVAESYARRPMIDKPEIAALAQSILTAAGLSRDPARYGDPADHRIAAAISEYLSTRFSYTLDLPKVPEGVDPVFHFLTATRKGHCEYFASGLAALLRSAGIRARVVTGFIAGEFNTGGDFYTIREADAHAWVEAYCPGAGWKSFDPTPIGSLRAPEPPGLDVLAVFRSFYQYVDFLWISHVIGYDDSAREAIIGKEMTLTRLIEWVMDLLTRVAKWFDAHTGAGQWSLPLSFTSLLLAWLLGIAAIVWIPRTLAGRFPALALWMRAGKSVRRRAASVDFYARMLRILSRAGFIKPDHQTPAAFARKLLNENPRRFAPVAELTDLYYQIRFGARPLDPARQQQAKSLLSELKEIQHK